MPFAYGFSASSRAARPSPIRELFKLIQRPGMISFAGGLPDPRIFPIAEFAGAAAALESSGRVALQYGDTEGYRPLIDQVRERSAPLGRAIAPEEVIITSGSQQIMDLLARVLLDPGDTVVVEAPTYPGALHTFRAAGARFAVCPADERGMVVDELAGVVARATRETGRRPKLIYSIVNFANPSGACLDAARRVRLAAAAAELGIPVLEDDPYGELRFAGAAPPTVFSLAPGGGVIYASSFSKILAPGVRVAWAVGDAELIRKMAIAKQGMDLCTSVVSQVLVSEYIRRGHLEGHLPRIRAHYAEKARAMAAALAAHLPRGAASWDDPQGGFFFWVRLAGPLTARELFKRAVNQGVAFLPGDAFYPDPAETIGPPATGEDRARLCFTFATPEQIEEGARRLAAALA